MMGGCFEKRGKSLVKEINILVNNTRFLTKQKTEWFHWSLDGSSVQWERE